jgi:hypothetical protein
MFKITWRSPIRNWLGHCTGHSFIVQQGLRHYATREQAEHQVALFKSLFPDTLHYVVPA